MLIDLQLHSTYSDGYLTPTELVEFISKKGIKVASLTDHNTVGGLYEFEKACRKKGIKAIKGIEIYTKYKSRKINILWYNFNEDDPELHHQLRLTQIRRRRQFREALLNLKKKGFDIDPDLILDKYTHYVPINRVISDITANPFNIKKIKKELGVRKTLRVEDIIENYFRNQETAVLHNAFIGLNKIIQLRKKNGGQLIICHPAKNTYVKREEFKEFKKLDIDGIEVLSPHHTIGATMFIQKIARAFDFIETGGSDFHQHEGEHYLIQNCYDYFKIDSKYLRKINKVID